MTEEPSATMTSTPIRTITGLIARLEEVRADLDTRHLTTLRQYEHVGWALRPLDSLIDQCQKELETIILTDAAEENLARALPKGRP